MQAVTFSGHGDSDVIEYGEHPDHTPGQNDVLIDVKAVVISDSELDETD